MKINPSKSLREQWELFTNEIEKYKELYKETKKRKKQQSDNIEYHNFLDQDVERYMVDHDLIALNINPFWVNEVSHYEEINYIASVIAENRFYKFGYYFSNDTKEDLENGDAETYFLETVNMNICYKVYSELMDLIDKKLEILMEDRKAIIYNEYQEEFEAACDYLYYGENGEGWADVRKNNFKTKDDMNFVWEIAFKCMSCDNNNEVFYN